MTSKTNLISIPILTAVTILYIIPFTAFGYQVYIGIHCTPNSAAWNLNQWNNLAAHIDGVNFNPAPFSPIPGYPYENDLACTENEWRRIMNAFNDNAKNNVMVETARTSVYNPSFPGKPTIESRVKSVINRIEAPSYGCQVTSFMIYDEAKEINGESVVFQWTQEEIQECRRALDDNGWSDVKLMFDARNNGTRSRDMAQNPLIDEIMIEAAMYRWDDNIGNIKTFLDWFWNNPATNTKKLFLQIPTHHNAYAAPPRDAYTHFRRVMHDLSDLMGVEFMRSPNVVFLPVTYNKSNGYQYYPELNPDDSSRYNNSLTGLALSIIEQRDLFESRNGPLTTAITDSYDRTSNINPIWLDLETVDNFESYPIDTTMNNQTSPGQLAGLWDTDDEGSWHSPKAGRVVADGSNQVLYQEYRYNGRRTLCVDGLTDPIDVDETGAFFFRFKIKNTDNSINWYAGVHELTGTDPLPESNADETHKLIAGFHAVSNSTSTFNIKTLDDSTTLMSGLIQEQWYNVWMVLDNASHTYDLYLSPSADGDGKPDLLKVKPIGSALTFAFSTATALTGGLWHQAGEKNANVMIDQIAWSGKVPAQLPITFGNNGLPWKIDSNSINRIEAENYNLGGEGIAYHDTTTGNTPADYRSDDVDIQTTTDAGGGYNIGYINAGEWLEYSLDVQHRGIYRLTLRTARKLSGSSAIRVWFEQQDKTGLWPVPSTTDWQLFTNIQKEVRLSPGRQVMRIDFVNDSQNLNWIELTYLRPDPDFTSPLGIGLEDLACLSQHWLSTECSPTINTCSGTDLNDSGQVDLPDLMLFCDQWLNNRP